MLLKSVRLHNIRSYIDDTINFTPGSSLLFGDIGSGKTTILLSIEFALFGLIKGDVSGETLLRHGTKEGSVELAFSIEGKDFIICRKLKRKSDTISQDSGHIISDNTKFEGTPIELKSRILELCGYPEDMINKNTSLIYRYTVYTPQEDMKSILFEGKEERLDTLRKIFNIDKYKRIRENALSYAKELRNMKKILEAKAADYDRDISELSERKTMLLSLEKEKAMIDSRISTVNAEIEDKGKELVSFEERMKELNDLNKNLEMISMRIKIKKNEIDKCMKDLNMADYRIKEYESKLADLGIIEFGEEELRNALKDSEDKLSKINAMKETVKERLESRKEDLQKIIIEDQASMDIRIQNLSQRVDTIKDMDREYENARKASDEMNMDLNGARIAKNNAHAIIKQIEGLNACPTCLQKVDFSHKVKITDTENAMILECDRRIHDTEKKVYENDRKLQQMKSELEDLRKDELELNTLRIRSQTMAEKISLKKQLEAEIDDLSRKKEKLDSFDVNKLMETISRNRRILNNIGIRKHINESLVEKHARKQELEETINTLNTDMKSLSQNHQECIEKISSYSNIDQEYRQRKAAHESLRSDHGELQMKMVSIQKDINTVTIEIVRISDNIETKKKIKVKINYISELNHWITEHFISLASTIEKSIMQKAHKEFNSLFRQWFYILMDDDNLTISLDEEFTPMIEQNSYRTFIENLSGGEKTAVALAYRLALNKVINDLINTIKTRDIIILDEPTDGFSSEQLDKMRDVFRELKIGQLIIVSHESKLESYVQNIIRISKIEHESKVMA
jgi:DNA repair protein SbcC/Rad50